MEHVYSIPAFERGDLLIEGKNVSCQFTQEKLHPQDSVGAEVELALVDEETLSRINTIEVLKPLPPYAHAEVSPEVVEINIQPGTLNEVSRRLEDSQRALCRLLREHGVAPFPFGKAPFADEDQASDALWESLRHHSMPHYRYLVHRDGDHLRKLTGLSGIQFHYQEKQSGKALAITKGLAYLTPYFAALSASSPVSDGKFRNYRSERTVQKGGLPYSGTPPANALESLSSLREYLNQASQNMRTLAPGYYDVRLPRVEYGTVENCSMDSVPDIRIQQALLAFNTAICSQIGKHVDAEEDLPPEFFGDFTLAGQDRTWIQVSKYSLLTRERLRDASIFPVEYARGTRSFPAVMNDLLDWSQCDDATKAELLSFIDEGTYAERIVSDLAQNPRHRTGTPTVVDPEQLAAVYNHYSVRYASQLAHDEHEE